jgi:His/Glu/Gln/Arg/opine family amino acid ABC transporter permease subunit
MSGRKFTIGVATPRGMSAPYAYFMPAVAFGYDRDEGLEFAFFYGGEPGSTARSLCQGACDIACLNTIVGFMGRAEGLPMLAIGSKARRAHRYFAVMPESAAGKLADLHGKMIACEFPHIQPLAEAALAEENVAPGEFKWVPWHGSGMQIQDMIEPLRRRELDAVFIMDWTDGDAIARGLKLRHLRSTLLERIKVSSCLAGIWLTVVIVFLSLVVAIVIGLLVCAGTLLGKGFVHDLCVGYVALFRALPEPVIIFWMYYCGPLILNSKLSAFESGTIALAIPSGAYLAEIFRAGIQAVPRGQIEAGRALGLPSFLACLGCRGATGVAHDDSADAGDRHYSHQELSTGLRDWCRGVILIEGQQRE